MLNAHVALTILNLFISTCLAVVSYTVSGSNIVVTTNSVPPFIVTINKNSADITSILFNGIQYQSSSKQSQIGSGLGTAPCAPSSFNDSYVKVVCVTSTLQQTYVFRSGDSNIYMSTYTTAEPSIGELRWISRLSSARLPNGPFLASSIYGNTQTVEGSDVFRVPYQGVLQTRSKFYSSQRFIDDQYHYIYGNSAYATMVMPGTAYETSSGGPFFRDINDQNVTDIHELYFYMNSGHVQTESFRTGQFGPYALAFSTSKPDPSIGSLDLSFFEQLNITGLILKSQRGYVNGTISNSQSYTGRYILHWYNTAAQYWTYANATYMSPAMKPGNYTVVVYREEFMVATGSVPVYPGVTNTANIVGRLIPVDILWQIGKFDGQPFEFQNAGENGQLRMHPSDLRQSPYNATNFTIGQPDSEYFPSFAVGDLFFFPIYVELTCLDYRSISHGTN